MPNPLHDRRYIAFRALLIELRVQQGLTQVQVASRLGKPQSYVSKYERGERRLDVVEMIDVAGALEVDAHAILTLLIDRLASDVITWQITAPAGNKRPE